LAQQFGKVLVKQLSIYVLVYLKLWFEKVKISDISENRIFFATIFLAQVLAQLYMNSVKSSAQKNWEIHPGSTLYSRAFDSK
jgi:bifunctional DNase/RNase